MGIVAVAFLLVASSCASGVEDIEFSSTGGTGTGATGTGGSGATGAGGAACVPQCAGFGCGETEPTCATTCGGPCDAGCTGHCSDTVQSCDETGVDCGGASCAACNCVPECVGFSCGQTEPTCATTCGDACDPGCTAHCSNGVQDCDETGNDCGGASCSACACVPDCAGYGCGQTEPTCATTCGAACDPGCSAHCSNGVQDCDETGVDCGGATCSACVACGATCAFHAGTCNAASIGGCDGCDMGCASHDPDCDGSACMSACPCLVYSNWYCDGYDDCADPACECPGDNVCVPDCAGYGCGQTEPTCGTTCGAACDAGCTAHCSNGLQDCDETGIDCGGASCSACGGGCGTSCFYYDGSCSAAYIGACDGCDMGCGVHDPDCDGGSCLSACPCLSGYSNWYCDGYDDCADPACECAGDNPNTCGTSCFHWTGSCSAAYIGACDGCDMGCGVHDPDCDGSTCMSACPCLSGYSNWYCDGWDDCSDTSCECSGE